MPRIAIALAAVVALTGCYVTRTSVETQSIHVMTAPPGADVWREEACPVRSASVGQFVAEMVSTTNPLQPVCDVRRDHVGRSPVDVRYSYEVTEQRLRATSWLFPAAGAASTLLGALMFEEGAREVGLAVGLVGFAGLLISVAMLAIAPDSKVRIEPIRKLTIAASLEGYHEDHAVLAGDPSRQPQALRLSLPPVQPGSEPQRPATLTQTSTPAADRPSDRARSLPDELRPDRYRPPPERPAPLD